MRKHCPEGNISSSFGLASAPGHVLVTYCMYVLYIHMYMYCTIQYLHVYISISYHPLMQTLVLRATKKIIWLVSFYLWGLVRHESSKLLLYGYVWIVENFFFLFRKAKTPRLHVDLFWKKKSWSM